MDYRDIIKAAINYAVPTILALGFGVLKPSLRFVWSDVILTWRGLLIVMATAVTSVVYPWLGVWAALSFTALFTLQRVYPFFRGVSRSNVIVFGGFFSLGPDGSLIQPAAAGIPNVRFVETFSNLINSHRIQKIIPIALFDLRPPAFLSSWLNYESFGHLMRRHSRQTLGCVWGVTEPNGKYLRLEITVNPDLYSAGNQIKDFIDDIKSLGMTESLPTKAAVDLFAHILTAWWGQSLCDSLIAQGRWQDALFAAVDSRHTLEIGVSKLAQGERSAEDVVSVVRKRILPVVLSQEASCLVAGKKWREGLETLFTALKLNPLFPLDPQSFDRFYNYNYAWNMAQSPIMPNTVAERLKSIYQAHAMKDTPPILELFLNWIAWAPKENEAWHSQVDGWFQGLTKAFPSIPYLYLYWGDAIKKLAQTPGQEPGVLPLVALDRAIQKYKIAERLAPDNPIVSSRIFGTYGGTLSYFPEASPEHKFRFRQVLEYGAKSTAWMIENVPFELAEEASVSFIGELDKQQKEAIGPEPNLSSPDHTK